MNHTIQLHIVLSTLALVVLCLAAGLAVALAWRDHELRRKRGAELLPSWSLERLESRLFQAIKWGFLLLTLDVVTSLWFFHTRLTPLLWHKTFLVLFAWAVFLILLLGRHYFGWRSRLAIRWTLIGVFLVVIAYLGSLIW